MRRTSDATRERLNGIADELAVIAAAAYAPSDREIAAALLLEAQRIDRVTSGRVDVSGPPQAR
jgi:hypothetical protein